MEVAIGGTKKYNKKKEEFIRRYELSMGIKIIYY